MNKNQSRSLKQKVSKIATNHPCTRCGNPAVIFQPYSGMHLCEQHLVDDVTRKAKRDIRKYNLQPGTIAVALSGGKDSSALLHLLHKIFAMNRKIGIIAITIDEGISGYRAKTIENASNLASNLGIPHTIITFEDAFGRTLDDLMKESDRPPCSVCGALRKNLLNRTAKELGATYLAIGHNLDDEAQTILANHLRGDIRRLVRLSHERVQPGLVPRIKPLRHVPESEVVAYARAVGLQVCPKACPYMDAAYRLGIRMFLREFEDRHPGTRHGIVRGFDRIVGLLGDAYPPASLVPCRVCGEPCTDGLCQACKMLGKW
ncbi:MAG: TIGR00269 family protein [Euryarchaeota archaeon]|nr:TIGR00269 family protein [Euryarchaeota archaeon]